MRKVSKEISLLVDDCSSPELEVESACLGRTAKRALLNRARLAGTASTEEVSSSKLRDIDTFFKNIVIERLV